MVLHAVKKVLKEIALSGAALKIYVHPHLFFFNSLVVFTIGRKQSMIMGFKFRLSNFPFFLPVIPEIRIKCNLFTASLWF